MSFTTEEQAIEITEKKRRYMWPSLEVASSLYNLANLGLIIGLVVGVISTMLLVWMGSVKEGYLDEEIGKSRERTALLEKQSGEARIAISKANADAAQSLATAKQAEQRAAEARLALENFKAPRSLSEQDKQIIISNLMKFPEQEYTAVLSSTGLDIRPLWVALDAILTSAGWLRVSPAGLASGDPPAGIAIESSPGVILMIDRDSYSNLEPAITALLFALNQSHIDTKLGFGRDSKEKRLNVITIRIGPKPQ